jgi:DNA replication and repair protein RecF
MEMPSLFIKHICITNFRNYEKAEIFLSSQLNLIQGENAQGKTNLLEAIYFLSTGRSFRTRHLSDLIHLKHPFFYLEAHFEKEGVEQTIKASFDGTLRKIQYNHTTYSAFSSLLGLIPSVLIAPEDILLINGSPGERRRFLDLHIAQSDPIYVHHLIRYFKALKQRNTLLRKKEEAAIQPWEHAMAISASYILHKRSECVAELNHSSKEYIQELTDAEDSMELLYESTLSLNKGFFPQHFYEQFEKSRKRELQVGNTLIGPHRDDLVITVNGKAAKDFSSEGQKRTCVTALRLAEWKRLFDITGYPPLMGIDDFGIHLDSKRYFLIQKKMNGLGQVFLTTPHVQHQSLLANHTLLVKSGHVNILRDKNVERDPEKENSIDTGL